MRSTWATTRPPTKTKHAEGALVGAIGLRHARLLAVALLSNHLVQHRGGFAGPRVPGLTIGVDGLEDLARETLALLVGQLAHRELVLRESLELGLAAPEELQDALALRFAAKPRLSRMPLRIILRSTYSSSACHFRRGHVRAGVHLRRALEVGDFFVGDVQLAFLSST